MKKFLFTLLFFGIAWCLAAEMPGVRATVELVSGATQSAQFLGIQNDTVSLGGSIKGHFTVVKIPVHRFKSIVDEQGNSLLPPPDTAAVPNAAPASAPSSAPDSSESKDTLTQGDAPRDSMNVDSLAQDLPRERTLLDSVEGKHIFVSLERRSRDSVLAEQLENLIVRLLKESGTPITIARGASLSFCSDAGCIRDSLFAHGATSVYTGRITAARAPDSVAMQATHYIAEDSTVKTFPAQISLSAIRPFGDALGDSKLSLFVATLQGEKITGAGAPPKDNKSHIHVETDPEGASIAIHGQEDVCKSPCTFATTDTGKVILYAYWNVNRQLWSAKSTIKPIPGDTAKISLKLKKVRPEIRVSTTPEGAEIYAGSAPLTPRSSPIGYSPNKFPIDLPGLSTVQVRKVGFRDTLVTFFASPTEITDINIELTPITSIQEQIAQDEWQHIRKKNFIGRTLMGTSIAPFLLGALFTYLATVDYDDADRIKDNLNFPASGGENYKAEVQKNKDLVDSGDRKMIIGGSLLGVGAILLGVGFVLTF